MNLRPLLLLCATFGTLAPCFAQSASPALKARLRAQINAVAPQLTNNGSDPSKDDELALPMAQLGDAATANRLASTQLARDNIAQWRVEQRAMRSDWIGAAQQAASVRDATVRADSFLVIARLATDKADFRAARTALFHAMSALDKAPNSDQLSYAGWLWWRLGDVAAARRVFVGKAWPAARREDERDKEQSAWFPRDKQNGVLRFVGRCGLLREFVQSVERAEDYPGEMLIADIAQSPDDVDFFTLRLFERLNTSNASQDELYLLAIQLAQRGQIETARQVRARAQALPATPVNAQNPDARYIPFYHQILLSAQLDDSATFAALTERWPEQIRGVRDAEELELIPHLVRVISQDWSGSPMKLREDAARADIDDLAARLLKNSDQNSIVALAPLIEYYAPRDAQMMQSLVGAVVAQLDTQKTRMDAEKRSGSYSWRWNYEATEIANQLRDSSHAAAAHTIVSALLRDTPAEFRQGQAQQFMRTGWDKAARQMFDPLESLQRQLKTNPSLDHGWADYAEAEARYRGADAPALWFGALKTPQQRAEVLPGWAQGLVPRFKIAPPYVRARINVGQDDEISVWRADAEA